MQLLNYYFAYYSPVVNVSLYLSVKKLLMDQLGFNARPTFSTVVLFSGGQSLLFEEARENLRPSVGKPIILVN